MDTATVAAPSLVEATIDHLRRFAPFDQMTRECMQFLASRLKVGFYAAGETLLSPEQGIAERFFIIKQGVVQGEHDMQQASDDEASWELSEGECFPLGALLAKRPVASVYRAQEDTFCYEMSAEDFHLLMHKSHPFHDFCTRRLAALLEQSKALVQARYSRASSEQQSMNSPLSAVIKREPVHCPPGTPLKEALATMQKLNIGSMVITEDGAPLGIFTLHDVLNRVALPQLSLDEPISQVMSKGLVTLPPDAYAYEAALAMAREGIRHVLVVEDGRLMGLVSEKDLFALQRVGLRQISNAIRSAQSVEELKEASAAIRQLAMNMLAQGVSSEQLTQFISTLNDLLTVRVVELALHDTGLAGSSLIEERLCWLALGSEGRYEQTLSTDQDNGIIFVPVEGENADDLRKQLLPLAQRINKDLDTCGFPLCKGNVMAGNPEWCLSLDEWKHKFAAWIDQGDPEALLNASIFFDFRGLYGNLNLAHDLRRWLAGKAKANPRFLHQMAANALRNRPPLGLVRDFVVGEDNTIDLKLNGASPFTDSARIFCLAHGLEPTNTPQRLKAAGLAMKMDEAETDSYIEAYHYIQMLRLRHQYEEDMAGRPMNNHLDPDELNDLDRRILKESFRLSRKLQSRLSMDYQL